MKEKSIRSTGIKSMVNVKSAGNLITLKSNGSFCNSFTKNKSITFLVDNSGGYDSPESKLIYDYSGSSSVYEEVLGKIIDLLLQLRAAQSDQNVFAQNNTVVREQILNQLQNEILRVNHKLSKNQIKNLEVISSNSFDEDKLNEILKSFLESSKKKSLKDDSGSYGPGILNNINLRTLENIRRTYSSVLGTVVNKKSLTHRILNTKEYENKKVKTKLINIDPYENRISEGKPESSNRAYSGKLINRKTVYNVEETAPESAQFYEEKIIKNISETIPEIKKIKKFTHTDFLTTVNSFVENILKSAGIETKLIPTNIKKVKNFYQNKTIQDRKNVFDVSHKLINRKNINIETENQENLETERQDLKKYNYLINNKFNELLKDENIISKQFRIKNQKYQHMVDFVKTKNDIISEEDLNFKKISKIISLSSKNLIYKNINSEGHNFENIDSDTIINKILKTSHIKDVKKQTKEIEKNIKVIKQKDIHEKYDIKNKKFYENKVNYFEAQPLTHKIESVERDSEIINKEDIYKIIPKLRNETKVVKSDIQTNVLKNITRFLDPIVNKRTTFRVINKELNSRNINKNLTYLTDKTRSVREKILINDANKTYDLEYKVPEKKYMIYKEEKQHEHPSELPGKEEKKSKFEKKVKNKEIEKVYVPSQEKVDLSKIKKEIISNTLKREDVEKMIQSYMSKINLDSISRRVIKDMKQSIEIENMRNGIFN